MIKRSVLLFIFFFITSQFFSKALAAWKACYDASSNFRYCSSQQDAGCAFWVYNCSECWDTSYCATPDPPPETTAIDPTDLQVKSFALTNSSGTSKTFFNINEPIYVSASVINHGYDWPRLDYYGSPTATYQSLRFFSHAPNPIYSNTSTTAQIDFDTDTRYWEGDGYSTVDKYKRIWGSFTGGGRNSEFGTVKSFSKSKTGDYIARFIIEAEDAHKEGSYPKRTGDTDCTTSWCKVNYANNQAVVPYRVGGDIAGKVYIDSDRNNSISGETGVYTGGAAITLTGPVSKTTTSAADGSYSFTDLPTGTYTVTITVPSSYRSYVPRDDATSRSTTISSTNFSPNIDFGINVLYSISGRACNSLDADCADTTDATLSTGRISFNLSKDQNGDGLFTIDEQIASQQNYSVVSTGYLFDNLDVGSYQVRINSTDTRFMVRSASDRTTTLGPDKVINFALNPYILTGTVYIDSNRDGSPVGETGVYPGATVTIKNGTTVIGTVTTDATGSYSFSDQATLRSGGTYTVELTPPTGYVSYSPNPLSVNIPLYSNTKTYTANFGINNNFSISGKVYVDYDNDSTTPYAATNDMPLVGKTVTAINNTTGATTTTTTATTASGDIEPGDYIFSGLNPGSYTITMPAQTDYVYLPNNTSTGTLSVTIGTTDSTGNDFRLFGKYKISGQVFIDSNYNATLDTGESKYPSSSNYFTVTAPAGVPKPSRVNRIDGTYQFENLISNTAYVVRYTGLPSGYVMSYPANAVITTPPSYSSLQVGAVCTFPSTAPGAACISGNITNLNFAIKQGVSWWQAYGLNVRIDDGVTNSVTDTSTSSCNLGYTMTSTSSEPGILFSGKSVPNLSIGKVSTRNWQVGSVAYPELYSSTVSRTSYSYMKQILSKSNITATSLTAVTGCSNLASCSLPATLSNGVYKTDGGGKDAGNVTIKMPNTTDIYTFPANKNFVFIINGDLTITNNIRVPTTSTATFYVSGNIIISSNVGSSAISCPPPSAGSGDLEGFYSADNSFEIQSSLLTDCSASPARSDKQLNIQGSIVLNASQTGGSFTNDRTLCTNDATRPSVTFKERPDMILNAPELTRDTSYQYQEVAP